MQWLNSLDRVLNQPSQDVYTSGDDDDGDDDKSLIDDALLRGEADDDHDHGHYNDNDNEDEDHKVENDEGDKHNTSGIDGGDIDDPHENDQQRDSSQEQVGRPTGQRNSMSTDSTAHTTNRTNAKTDESNDDRGDDTSWTNSEHPTAPPSEPCHSTRSVILETDFPATDVEISTPTASNTYINASEAQDDYSDVEVDFPIGAWKGVIDVDVGVGIDADADAITSMKKGAQADSRGQAAAHCRSTPAAPAVASTAAAETSLNAHGVIHVRLLRARRLPCPVGSTLKAAVSLPPWKGKVRTEQAETARGPESTGVYARWDQLSDAGLCSMVNEWNGPKSPMPSIRIELICSPLGMGVVMMSIGSCTVSCDPLFQSPCEWHSQWCYIEPIGLAMTPGSNDSKSDSTPILHMEAMFEPGELNASRHRNYTISDTESQGSTSFVDFKDSTTSVRSGNTRASQTLQLPPKIHMTRVRNAWVPAQCSVCERYCVGRASINECENCKLRCCMDCRLNFDLKIPCGSELARSVLEKSARSQLTMEKIMSIVAPVERDDKSAGTANAAESDRGVDVTDDGVGKSNVRSLDQSEIDPLNRTVGVLKLEILDGCVFASPYEPDTSIDDIVQNRKAKDCVVGDYYVRIKTSTQGNTIMRTKTIQQTSSLFFGTGQICLDVEHHFMEYKLEIIDALTDKPLACALLTASGILQQQRDLMLSKRTPRILDFVRGSPVYKNRQKVHIPLRRKVKGGFHEDFFPQSRHMKTSKPKDSSSPPPGEGEIMGWIEASIGLEEYFDRFYCRSNPLECPPRPQPTVSLSNFQLQIARVKSLIQDIKSIVADYRYVVTWQDPMLSFVIMVVLLVSCLSFNAEYALSLPLGFICLAQIRLSWRRSKPSIANHFIEKEIDLAKKAMGPESVFGIHKPLGMVTVNEIRGKSLVSKDYGLVGKTTCHVLWRPEHTPTTTITMATAGRATATTATAPKSDADGNDDPSERYDQRGTDRNIGFTDGIFTSDPAWERLHYVDSSRRLLQLLAPIIDADDGQSNKKPSMQFPVVQSSRPDSDEGLSDDGPSPKDKLLPWHESSGAVVFRVMILDLMNPGSEDTLGDVVVPLSTLARDGAVSGWFDVSIDGRNRHRSPSSSEVAEAKESVRANAIDVPPPPQIYVSLGWKPIHDANADSNTGEDSGPSMMAREASYLVQEDMSRFVAIKSLAKKDFWGSSIGAFNSAMSVGDTLQTIQNVLCAILNAIDVLRNLFNFTDPFKSSIVFASTFLIWVLLICVPSRYLILAIGMSQFVAGFFARRQGSKKRRKKSGAKNKANKASGTMHRHVGDKPRPPFIVVWLRNFIRTLPTNEDLRKTYFWQSRLASARFMEEHAFAKRTSRLQKLWQATWYGQARLRENSLANAAMKTGAVSPASDMAWLDVFVVLQGHRLLWWSDARSFDVGDTPVGSLFLAGHSGLTNPSPLELRRIPKEDLDRIVCIFGKGEKEQIRITILASDAEEKDVLENAVLEISLKND